MSNPSIFTQLFTFSKAITTQVLAGCPIASDEEIKKRAEVCSTCPFLKKEEYRCGVCNCKLQYKIPWSTSKCPKGLWEKIDDNTNE